MPRVIQPGSREILLRSEKAGDRVSGVDQVESAEPFEPDVLQSLEIRVLAESVAESLLHTE
jgi:hypothetical protein